MAYAVATAILGATPWQYLSLVVQKQRTALPAAYEPWTWADFLALPTVLRAYRAPAWATVQGYTARAIHLEGYIAEAYRFLSVSQSLIELIDTSCNSNGTISILISCINLLNCVLGMADIYVRIANSPYHPFETFHHIFHATTRTHS
jgi:hypothetical protein